MLGREAVRDDVVDEAAARVEQAGVDRLAIGDARQIVGDEPVRRFERALALELDLAHVADVEEARLRANGFVLGDETGVLHRELPTGEVDEAASELLVGGVQRRQAW